MGKAGRVACIITPMLLTFASLVCLLLVELGGTNQGSAPLSSLYFLKVDPSGISDGKLDLPDLIPNTKVDNNLIGSALKDILKNGTDKVEIDHVYTVSLWNYCYGDIKKNNYEVKKCMRPYSGFWFNPIKAFGLEDLAPVSSYPKEVRDGLNVIKNVSKWMFAAYAIAFFVTLAELVCGFFAIFSRWGSFVTSILSGISTFATIAAAGTATGLYATLMGTINASLGKTGVKASLGRNMMTTTWLAVAFSIAAGLFWVISICCCSGRSGHKKVKVEKTPYTYERVASPYLGPASGPSPAVPMQQYNTGHKSQAYEPYRSTEV
ncbi:MAG: hypothetical protein M1825_005153 [Sarcosagium campestre]|nr:MAG: hypothetical protein M1825_005153 [Sarcosagium campestre]